MSNANRTLQTLELLAPAKNADIGIEAINHGADAVYIGGPAFSARANAGNSLSDLERLCEHAHRYRARIYMALNTIFTDAELVEAEKLARDAWNVGVDALIVQDMGLLECDLPPIQLHASTQCDIRTPEKAKFLESVGFSQIVPARELSLEEIRAVYDALDSARIEYFIHGALCVSFSGQCYASQAVKGRSANRGDCAQLCRLPFDIYDEDGSVLKKGCHALSLKDNNQSANIAELIEAGVRSFKIEGRYKDVAYVKNTCGYYRRLIDQYLTVHQEFERESEGRCHLSFEPDPNRTFNRGTTDYFVHGRGHSDITSFDTPKNAGAPAGTIRDVLDLSFILKSDLELNNGDGLTYYRKDGELGGLLVNRAENLEPGLWEIFLRDPCRKNPDLQRGLKLMRNRDSAWTRLMESDTATRRIPIKVTAEVGDDGIRVTAEDEVKNRVYVERIEALDPAKNPERAAAQLASSLSKLGDTVFEASSVDLEGDTAKFLPVSVINALRRELVAKLEEERTRTFTKLPADKRDESVCFPQSTLDYRGNVLNRKAQAFYAKHGVTVEEPAFETGLITREVELMRCKHCIRYALDLCPKEAKKRGEKIKPTPLVLKSGNMTFTAHFHCKPCEMSITGKKSK